MAGRVYAEVYGCPANAADGEIALGLLRDRGYRPSNSPADADILLLVTCAVKKPTADRMISRIKKLSALGGRLVVTGCMVTGEASRLREVAPTAQLIEPRQIARIADAIEGSGGQGGLVKLGLPRVRRNPVVSIVPVSEGCRWSRCSFCIVPRSRPGYVSYPVKLVVDEVRRGLTEGCKEFWLTSQDMGSYGLESGRNMLPELLQAVDEIDGMFFVRVGMMNPIYLRPILERLVKSYLGKHIFRFLHLPVQSGSNHVLREMQRGHTVDLFLEIVSMFRQSIPMLTLSTDIIVGYPAEDEDDFEETLRLVEMVKPDVINISRFFPRPGTPAERLKPLPPNILSRRVKLLREVAMATQLELNCSWVGWEGLALVDEVGRRGTLIARNQSYKPIVFQDVKVPLGSFVKLRVVDSRQNCLMGVVSGG
ncbi:MAG: tRNA (N(6)-L-threonylcarbamoyladenosine(37)-C(2))-methylthiotransferase [Nitrososphaerota archaeon]